MLHSTQVMLIRRLLGLLERGTTDMDPEPVQQPVDVYTSSERLERERMLLQRVPIMLESTARLRKPGDFVTHDALGIPLLLCVDKAGDIRAFINVCRHRGARLVEDDSGVSRHVFVCPYHGWAYAGDGRLSHIPHAYGFAEGHCDKTRLAPFPVTVRHGFVWTAPGPDVDHHLGRLAAEIAGRGIDGQHPAYQLEMSADANWKLLIEGGFETYHFRRVHAGTVYPVVYDNVALLDDFHPHQRLIVPKRSIEEHVRRDEAQWNLLSVANVVYLIFPNTILLVRDASVVQHSLFPDGARRSLWRTFATCRQPPRTANDQRRMDEDKESFKTTLNEDFKAASSVQKGLHSGANSALTFGRFEAGLVRFHRALDEFLATPARLVSRS